MVPLISFETGRFDSGPEGISRAYRPRFCQSVCTRSKRLLGPYHRNYGTDRGHDGHVVQFIQNVPQEDMNQTARDYNSVLRQILRRKRAVLFGQAVAFWLVPVISLYALGIAFRWVRRGFATAT